MFNLRPYQADFVSDIAEAWAKHTAVLGVLPTGAGKCLGRDTPVLMYNGEVKPVQDVRTGEVLIGPDSAPRIVLSTCVGREMLYRVTPSRGDAYVLTPRTS